MPLASYAITDENSKGRKYPIKKLKIENNMSEILIVYFILERIENSELKHKFSLMMLQEIFIVVDMIILWKFARLQNQ